MKKFKCPLCGSEKRKVFLKNGADFEYEVKGEFKLVKCISCGLIFLYPIPSIKQFLSAYPDSYHSYNIPVSKITQIFISLSLKQESKKIKKLISNTGTILDVGCADGRHFEILRKFGNWHFIGIDFKDKIAQKGRVAGREIYTATLEKFDYPKDSFDLMVMDHLLEHVTDPVLTLKAAHRLLKPGRYLIGAVPNINSFDKVLFGRYWGGYHLPRHVWHFTPKSLSKVLKKAGFQLKKLDYDLHTSHWALSIQNFFQSQKLTRTKIKQGRTFYYPLLLGVLIPINLIQKLLHCTAIISFVAQKE